MRKKKVALSVFDRLMKSIVLGVTRSCAKKFIVISG